MSQNDFGTIDPGATSGSALAALLDSWRDALHSGHKGATVPSYVRAGMLWVDDSADPVWALKFYDGSASITLSTFNVSTHAISLVINDSGLTIVNAATPTKKLVLSAAGITAGATRTLSAPNADGTIALLSDITSALTDLKWLSKGIGEYYAADSGEAGVDVPPTTNPAYRFALLTAGQTGIGQYNEGILTSESISGSSPTVSATSVISLSGSSMNGQAIRLLNSERRFLRAGSAGTLQDSDNLGHAHAQGYVAAFGVQGSGGPLTGGDQVGTTSSGGAEARPRNIGITLYRRIK